MMTLAYNHTNHDGTGRFVQRDEAGELHAFEVEQTTTPVLDGTAAQPRRIWRTGPVIKVAGVLPDGNAARAWVARG